MAKSAKRKATTATFSTNDIKFSLNDIERELEELKKIGEEFSFVGFSGCPDCTNGFILTDQGAKKCHCYEEEILRRKMKNANLSYQEKEINLSNILIGRYSNFATEKESLVNITDFSDFLKKFYQKVPDLLKMGAGIAILGKPGRGKTRTAASILVNLLEIGYKCYQITAFDLVRLYHESYYGNKEEKAEARAKLNNLLAKDIILLDELGGEPIGGESRSQLAYLDNFLRTCLQGNNEQDKKKIIIITSNYFKSSDFLNRYEERITSIIRGKFVVLAFEQKEDYRLAEGEELWQMINN